MKTRRAPLIIALMVLSALIISDLQIVKGQAARIERRVTLTRYGAVSSIPGPNSEGTTYLQHEGYAIAYRAKNIKTGEDEDRLAYVFGAQLINNLEPVKQEGGRTTARTRDGALEITSEAKWDEKLHELNTRRSIKVTAATEATILAIENHIDTARKANDIHQVVATVRAIQAALIAGPTTGGRAQDCDCGPCWPGRPCQPGYLLPSGAYRASLNMMETVRTTPALIAGSAGMPTSTQMSKGTFVNVLSWVRGVNMPSASVAPGDGLSYFASFKLE